jgi:hypothetical protein
MRPNSACAAFIYLRGLATQGFLQRRKLALALLVARVLADHHDPAITADHFALFADLLDARLDLHGIPLRVTVGQLERRSADAEAAQNLLVAVDDTTPSEVIRAQFHHYAVLRENPDVVLAHLP